MLLFLKSTGGNSSSPRDFVVSSCLRICMIFSPMHRNLESLSHGYDLQ